MASYRQNYLHIVFGTKNHKQTLPTEFSKDLYKYIYGIIIHKNCKLYRISGYKDHLHFLSDLHPNISLADYIKDIKISSSLWLKRNGNYPNFEGWAEGYACFTIAHKDRDRVIEYIKNQVKHHQSESFMDEYKRLLSEFGVKYDERYL